MIESRRAIIIWLATVSSVAAFVAGFTMTVDPFGYFGNNNIGYYFSSEKQFKYNLVGTFHYNAIVLGDSRIAYTDTNEVNFPGYKFVNGGIPGSDLTEQVALLKSSKMNDLKIAVFGLQSGDVASCEKHPEEQPVWEAGRHALSWTQIRYAILALIARSKGQLPAYKTDGSRTTASKRLEESLTDLKTERYWNKVEANRRSLQGMVSAEARLGQECRLILEEARSLAERHGFALMIIFLPRNADVLQHAAMSTSQVRAHTSALVSELKGIVPNVVDLTDSPLSDSRNFWLDDPVHFKPEIGAKIIETAIHRTEEQTVE